ncbi:V-set and immunoglobulin domain-containing protein 10-like 2 isoform X2 [Engraulis encrasicolus]|uniref:V-set and immunoglobulin domain-containing protein 10-like 2 isoform X2 n=1 Tax=Engraulis encrasicolus TaxID=184585 RepID=UPI002FD11D8C
MLRHNGLQILDPEEVEYVRNQTTAVAGGSVELGCGSEPPTIFIWAYTKPGSDSNQVLLYDYGHGPKLQPLSKDVAADMGLVFNSSTLLINNLPLSASGLYTCQALYETDSGAKITFFYNHLEVLVDGEEPGSGVSNITLA